MAVKAAELVEAARMYLGSPYRWWTGAFPEYGPPGYMDWQTPGYYDPGFVASEGVHCAGFINLARMECGLEPIGLTRAYEDWLWANGGVAFDADDPGVPGALCVRGWTAGTAPGVAEGHAAMYVGEHELIQATPSLGVHEGETDIGTYWWAQYSVYGLMPDVNYSETEGGDNGSGQPTTGSEPWKWLAITREGWAQFDGPDYSRGWFDTSWKWHRPSDSG